LSYCPRQCGLIHLEQAFEDNVHALRGQAVHGTVDLPGFEALGGMRIVRALALGSERLGLVGKADVVEFQPDDTPYPVEYKHGRTVKAQQGHDAPQLAAQTLCLEEMTGRTVPEVAMRLLNTLYVTLPDAHLRLDNDTLRIEVERETRLQVPLHHLTSVVCMGNVGFSTPLAHRLADEGITLVLLDAYGRFKARLEGAVSGNILLRQAQHAKALDPAFTVDAARAFVAGKIRNARQVLLRGARESKRDDEAQALARGADDLGAALRGLPGASTVDEPST
jgi:hypothetical protein